MVDKKLQEKKKNLEGPVPVVKNNRISLENLIEATPPIST